MTGKITIERTTKWPSHLINRVRVGLERTNDEAVSLHLDIAGTSVLPHVWFASHSRYCLRHHIAMAERLQRKSDPNHRGDAVSPASCKNWKYRHMEKQITQAFSFSLLYSNGTRSRAYKNENSICLVPLHQKEHMSGQKWGSVSVGDMFAYIFLFAGT